jgi:hypothetical protein
MVKISLDFLENPGYTDTMMNKETVMTKPLTKQGMIFECMNANADKPMDEVVRLILELKGVPGKALNEKDVRSTYLWAIRTGKAQGLGKGTGAPRAAKAAKSDKPAKAAKSKITKVPAPRIAGDKEKAAVNKNLTVEEINDIKAKNMARLQAVGRKYAKGQMADPIRTGMEHTAEEARAIVKDLEDSLDSFKAPAFLKLDDVKTLV